MSKIKRGEIDNELAEFARSLFDLEELLQDLFKAGTLHFIAEFTITTNKKPRVVLFAQKVKRACEFHNSELGGGANGDEEGDERAKKFFNVVMMQGDYLEDLFLSKEFLDMCEHILTRLTAGRNARKLDAREFAAFYHNISSRIQNKLAE